MSQIEAANANCDRVFPKMPKHFGGIATLAFMLPVLQTIIRDIIWDTVYHKILTLYILIN